MRVILFAVFGEWGQGCVTFLYVKRKYVTLIENMRSFVMYKKDKQITAHRIFTRINDQESLLIKIIKRRGVGEGIPPICIKLKLK
jgi:hypothetical protein